MNEAVINSKLPEDLARMEYIESDIHRHKFIHDEIYTMQEALKRGEYVEKRVEYARTVEKLDSKSLYYDETIEDSISFNGNGNSFLEVGELVFNDDSNKYNEFVKLVKKLK